ncbi:MAG: hydroxyacid dehydrogenase [Bacteroidetes bacterium]|nr:hydroxyacid dehydrogenase [Bacteroidota bacterium]
MKIIFIDTTHPILMEMLSQQGFSCDDKSKLSKEEIAAILPNYAGMVIRSRFKIDRDFIDKGTNLKFIARPGAGLENIDVAHAQSKGIACLRSPEGNRDSVAEHALGMLLSLFNNLKRADSEIRNGIWRRTENWGVELKGKTIGILGYGYMGEAFAQRLSGFGVKVLAYDKYKQNYIQNSAYMEESSMERIFKECDIVSLHLPLSAETNQLVNTAFINQFKKNFYLINTARGGIVNLSDLAAAIESGKVLGACLDVFEFEESSFESTNKLPSIGMDYLTKSEKVILSPHIAGWTHESNKKIAQVLAEKISSQFSV